MAITQLQPFNLSSSSTYTFGNVSSTGNVIVAGVVTATGNVTGANVVTTGNISGGNISVSGNIAAGNFVAPVIITTITYPGDDTAADTAGGQTITITGSGFVAGASVIINGSAVGVVSVVSSTTITFTSPAQSSGSYPLYIVNTNGTTGVAIPGIQYSGTPTWTTAAGSLGSYTETVAIANTVTATGDAPITYSLYSGTLPTGATLNTSNGYISGTSPLEASPTTFTFTIRATDAQQQDTDRQFSLTINPDVVTWSSPANGTSYTSNVNSAISNVTMSASAASGQSITYTANALPTGLSISGSNITGTPTVVANSSSLLTATAATTNATATRTISWVIQTNVDTYWPYVSLLLSANTPSSTFVADASTNNFLVTINGDIKPNSFNPYTPGYYSASFSTTSDYLSISSAPVPATGQFTIEGWIYTTTSATQIVYSQYAGADANRFHCGIDNNTGYKLYFAHGTAATVWGATVVPLNQWNHIAFTRDSSNTLRIFLNGVLDGSQSSYTSTLSTVNPRISGFNNTGTYNIVGYLSNFRTLSGSAQYTSNFTVPTSPLTAIANTSLLACQSNRFIDNSTNNYTLTRNGSPNVTGFIPFIPNSTYSTYGSAYFDGSGDYLSLAASTAWQMSTGDYTVECWYYPTVAQANVALFDQYFAATTGAGNWQFFINSSGVLLFYYDGGTGQFSTTATISPGIWYHIAATRSGTTIRVFVNGVQVGSTTSSAIFGQNNTLWFGAQHSAGPQYYPTGYCVDVRMVKGTAVYTAAFTPPSSPLTAIANTSLLTLQNNQSITNNVFVDNSTNNYLITRTGNTTSGTFSPYAGGYSNYFNGSTDYLSVPSTSGGALDLTTVSTFTIETWVYLTAFSAGENSIIINRPATGNFGFGFRVNPTGTVQFYYTAGSSLTTTATLSLNTWYHLAVVRSGANLYIFINGTLSTSSSSFANGSNTSQAVWIGYNATGGSSYFAGYISNLRVLNGTALYTTGFTTPTAPLTPITNTKLLTCQSNRFIDNSVTNATVTLNGSPTVQKFSPFDMQTATVPTSYSAYFDGTGDYLSISSSSVFNFGTGDFTVEFWVYGASQLNSFFYDNRGGAASGNPHITTGTSSPVLRWGSTGLQGSIVICNNAWHHCAVTRQSGTIKLWVDGVLDNSGADSTNYSSTQPVYIGTNSFSLPSSVFTGYLSNFRIVNGTAVYTSAFTPSTSPLTAIANTQLLTLQSTKFIDNSTNNFTITATGDSKPTIQNPFGYTNPSAAAYTVSSLGGSMYFDGTGDYLNSTTTQIIPATSNFTLEAYVYCTSFSASPCIISQGTSGSAGRFQFSLNTSGNIQMSITSSIYTSTGTIGLNSWNHLVITRSGSTFTFYINGVSSGTATDATSIQNTSIKVGVEWSTAYFPGYISGLRLLTGTILYTSNFVPPYLSPLTAVQNTTLLLNGTSAGIYDSSMNNDLETVGDTKISTAVKKYGNGSIYFDGTGDYLVAPYSPQYSLGTGNFTVEVWVNFGAFSGDDVLCALGPGIDASPVQRLSAWNLYYGSNNLYFSRYAPAYTGFTFSWTPSTGTWYHVAVSRSGTSLRAFINGTQIGTTQTSSTDFSAINTTDGLYVGRMIAGGGILYYLNGYLDDLRITKGIARYTSNFTAPTTPFLQY